MIANIFSVASDNLRLCIQESLLVSKKFIFLLHTLSAYNSLLVRYKVYLSDPRECLCTIWRYAETYENFSIDPTPSYKKKHPINLILTNPELFIIYWTCYNLFWFRFLKLLLIFYCQSSWQKISILKKQFLIRPGVS